MTPTPTTRRLARAATLLNRLVDGTGRCAAPEVVDTARRRREVRCRAPLLDTALSDALLAALRGAAWPTPSDRPKVEAEAYLVLEQPPPGAPTHTTSARRLARKRERHAAVWAAVAAMMAAVDPAFAYTGVALSKGFRGSPHIDTYDIDMQWALSLGEFEGGCLCVEASPTEVVVAETKGRPAKVDGRYVHWVAPWTGERYSVIVYKTRVKRRGGGRTCRP